MNINENKINKNNENKLKSKKKKYIKRTLILLLLVCAIVLGCYIQSQAGSAAYSKYVHLSDSIDMESNNITYEYYDKKAGRINQRDFIVSDDWLSKMSFRNVPDTDYTNSTLYGPYMWLPQGKYDVRFDFTQLGDDAFLYWDVGVNESEFTTGLRGCHDLTNREVVNGTSINDPHYKHNENYFFYRINTTGDTADYELRCFFSGTHSKSALLKGMSIKSITPNNIKFDAAGGTLNNKSTGTLTTTYWGAARENVSVPTKDGYTFIGWYGYKKASNTTSDRKNLTFDKNSGLVKLWNADGTPAISAEASYYDYTVYAQWEKNPTLTVNYDGGVGNVDDQYGYEFGSGDSKTYSYNKTVFTYFSLMEGYTIDYIEDDNNYPNGEIRKWNTSNDSALKLHNANNNVWVDSWHLTGNRTITIHTKIDDDYGSLTLDGDEGVEKIEGFTIGQTKIYKKGTKVTYKFKVKDGYELDYISEGNAHYQATKLNNDKDGYNYSDYYNINGNRSGYIHTKPASYTLTIDPNGGEMYNGNAKTSSVFTTKFLYGRKTYIGNSYTDKYGFLDYENNTPTREGYTFAGWKFSNGTGGLNSDGSEFFFEDIAVDEDTTYDDDNIYIFNGDYTGDVTATAQWTKDVYQQDIYVRYQNEDGSWGDYSDKYWHISTDEAPNGYWENFRWTIDSGATFWFGLDDINQDSRWDDTLYEFPDTFADGSSLSYTVTGESKKYVDIKRKQHTMNFNKGLTNSTATMSDVGKLAGDTYEIPLPKWLGRSYVITLDNDGSKTSISGNLSFDQWKGYKNIHFSEIKKDDTRYDWYSDGDLLENIRYDMTFVANWESEDVTLPTPTKTGYTFAGWYEDKTFTKKVNDTSITIEPDTTAYNKTLYAKWTKEAPKTAYLKTFSDKGISSTNYASGSNINIGENVTVTATVKTGYKFTNWTDGSGSVKSTGKADATHGYTFTMPANAVNLTANATANTYKVAYNKNKANATGIIADSTYTYDVKGNLRSNVYTAIGYKQNGWNTRADGKGEHYNSGAEVLNWTDEDGKVINLYAEWNIDNSSYTVKHHYMDLEGKYSDKAELLVTETLNEQVGNSVTPDIKARIGFTKPNTQTVIVKADGSTVVDYYYARNKYKVTLTKDDNINTTNQISINGEYYYGANVKVSATVKANTEQYTYSWKRWESSNTTLLANSTDKDYAFTMPAGNIMLKATGSNSTNGYSVVVNVRYQDVNGNWGKYESVINANYNYGSTVTWNRNADATYKAVNYSEKVTGNIVKNIDIERNKYTQTVMVRYENADGSFTNYNKEVSEDKFYGSTYTWNRNADTVYKAANIPDYTVTGTKENKVSIYRNTHTITVIGDSHVTSVIGSGTYRHGQTITISANTFSDGYCFSKWENDDDTNASKIVTVNGNATYKAISKAKDDTPYKVEHYQMNLDGKNYTLKETENRTGATDTKLSTLNISAKNYIGFSFDSSKTERNSDVIKGDGSTVIKYYYTRNSYSLTVNAGTGIDSVSVLMSTNMKDIQSTVKKKVISVPFGASVTINADVSDGYTWSKWYGSYTQWSKSCIFYMPANNVNMTASATANKYTVRLHANKPNINNTLVNKLLGTEWVYDNSNNYYTATFTYDAEENIPSPLDTYSISGYTADGWYTAATEGNNISYGNKKWNLTAANNGVVDLYAHWTENAYKINFNYNKPSNASNEMQNNQLKEKEVKYNNSIGTLPTPTLVGWTFAGWYTSPNGGNKYDSNTKYLNTGDTTVYAHWTANKYNIVFDANKPSTSKNPVTGNMAAIVCTYDTPVNIPTNSYQIKGWDFVGFNTKADGSGDNIIPGSTVINLTSVNNGVVTLYAQWDAHIEWNASLSKINNDSINALDLTNDDKAVNWEHGLGYGKIMHNTLTYIEFGDMQGFLDVEINNVVPTKIKYEFSDTRINSIQLSNDEHTNIGIENGKAVYLHNVSSAISSGYLHKISFNIPDYEAEFDVNKEKEYSAYVDISVSYNVRNTGNEITETRRVYYNLEELDMSKVHSRIRRQPGQANN